MSRAGAAARDGEALIGEPAPACRREAGAPGSAGPAPLPRLRGSVHGGALPRRPPRPARFAAGPALAPARGFTLLELVVVLALMALVTTLAMPGLERLSAGIAKRTERDRILDQFAGLGRQAMLHGRSYVVFGTGEARDAEPPEPAQERGDGAAPGLSSAPPSHAGLERYAIDLPQGWEIRLDPPLVVRANGVCLGAGLTLHHRGAVDRRVELAPPYCRVDADA